MRNNDRPEGLVMQDNENPNYGKIISKGDESLGLPDLIDMRTHITTGRGCSNCYAYDVPTWGGLCARCRTSAQAALDHSNITMFSRRRK